MKSSYKLKKTLSLVLFVFLFSNLFSQQTEFNYGNRWRFGLNIGGTWLASDLKNQAGLAGGFTIEKGLTKSKTAPLYFDLRYRFLSGNTYGLDGRVNRLIGTNKAVNGANDSVANYFSSPGYFFSNYRTHITQNDLELKVGFNQLLQKHKIHLYIWGGVGLTKFTTKVDALNSFGSKYNFSGVDTSSAGGATADLSTLLDHKYETYGDGMTSKGVLKFSPSLGIGFGYKFSNHFSLILEHKVTFPGTDILDGEQHLQKTTNVWSKTNDYYHYSGLKMLFTFGKASGGGTYTNNNNYTTVNNRPPEVTVISPSSNPYTSPVNNVQVYANVKNVTDASGISVTVNGAAFSNYNFTTGSGALSFSTLLQNGSNTVVIRGTNPYGTNSATVTINYNVTPQGTGPVVNISSPSNGSTVTATLMTVNANVREVTQAGQVNVNVNNVPVTNFTFNPSNGDVSFVANLNSGNNSIYVGGTNQYGNDSKTVNVYMNTGFSALPKPVITITNPVTPGYQSTSPTFNLTAYVANITSASQLIIQVNGVNTTNFSFNSSNGNLTVPANLSNGSTSFVITATNASGSDVKSTSVNYYIATPAGNPPVVTFTNPASSPYTSAVASMTVKAVVTNVNSKSDIQLYVNNTLDNNFSFNTSNNQLTYALAMNGPVNVITVVATNAFGSDAKNVTINYTQPVSLPTVTITNPPNMGYAVSNSSFTVNAIVTNVTSQNQITVNVNGSNTASFSYNVSSKLLTLPLTLNLGTTPVVITATNGAGSDVKTTSLVYTVPLAKPVVTYTNPTTDPFNTLNAIQSVTAQVLNVTQQNQIVVTMNGINTPFTFNSATHLVQFSTNLNPGNNLVSVTGTNAAGSDTKILTLILGTTPRNKKPDVAITTPAAAGTTVASAAYQFISTANNVNSISEITAQFNGVTVTGSFVGGIYTYNATLISGNNNFTISATNVNGSDQDATSINYQVPVVVNPPVVTLTNPPSAGITVASANFQFSAVVVGVTSASNISCTYNGATVPCQYNSGIVTYSTTLNAGNNTFAVSATNAGGSDQKSTSIIYAPVININPVVVKPVVTITNPPSAGTTVATANFQFKATVVGVAGASNVSCQFNGTTVTGQYNAGVLSYSATLNAGNNTFAVSATNSAGTDQKSTSINYLPVININPVVVKPVVTITNPPSPGTTVANANFQFSAAVVGVAGGSNVSCQFNGATVTGQYNAGVLTYNATLISGNNTFAVSANNSAGTDQKSTSIIYTPPAVVNPPVVTITNPPSAGTTVSNSNFQFTAAVSGVTSGSNVIVQFNGATVSSQYNNGVVTYNASLVSGNNTFDISASNAGGTDQKSTSIIYSTPVVVPAPVITFTDPNTPGTIASAAAFVFKAQIQNITSGNQLVVKLNGQVVSGYSYSNIMHVVVYVASLQNGNNTLEITATNSGGSDYKSTLVVFSGGSNGVTDTSRTQGSGPNFGNGGNGGNNNNDPLITICHLPPGNPGNPQQITIPTSAWPAHQAHGDTQGPCPPANNGGGNIKGGGNNNNSGGENKINPIKKPTITPHVTPTPTNTVTPAKTPTVTPTNTTTPTNTVSPGKTPIIKPGLPK
ncbi:MAG: hypothetical protein IAF38_12735 [Bacteroidia bacterium]|nr:hypothetical protein [Bacteroidia bacterium]